MRIVCPTCDAEYDVLDQLLPAGRATCCMRCRHQWVPTPIAAIVEVITEPPPEPSPPVFPVPSGPTAMDRLTATSAKPKGTFGLRLAWIGTFLLLIGTGVSLYAERAAVMAMWPPSGRAYGLLGLAPAAESPHPTPQHK